MPWLRQLVTVLYRWRFGFVFRPFYVGFMVEELVLGQDFLRVLLSLFCFSITPLMFRTYIWFMYHSHGVTRWRSWLRHCATSRKVTSSIPGGVIGIFHWHNHSGRTMALGLTKPLTEMSTRNISWEVKAVYRADNLPTFVCWLSWNQGASTFWNSQGLSRSVMGQCRMGHCRMGHCRIT